jgi:hypothetical protein
MVQVMVYHFRDFFVAHMLLGNGMRHDCIISDGRMQKHAYMKSACT